MCVLTVLYMKNRMSLCLIKILGGGVFSIFSGQVRICVISEEIKTFQVSLRQHRLWCQSVRRRCVQATCLQLPAWDLV